MSHFSKQSYNGSAKKLNLYHDDTFFKIILKYLDTTHQKYSQEFLDIFYYLIVCYSKVCFKRHANWQHHNTLWKFNTQTTFNYELANETRSHALLLSIQNKMFKYRKTFSQKRDNLNELITPEFITEYNAFVWDSLSKFADIIIKPVRSVRPTIFEQLKKYSQTAQECEQSSKKSRNINYEALQKVLAT